MGELYSSSALDRVISVDLRGVFSCVKYELREMARAGRGVIVNTASVAGVMAEFGGAAYVAANHGDPHRMSGDIPASETGECGSPV